jgi:hypothetical protein
MGQCPVPTRSINTLLRPLECKHGSRFSINREGEEFLRSVKENRVIRQQLPQTDCGAVDFKVFHRVIAAEAPENTCFPYTETKRVNRDILLQTDCTAMDLKCRGASLFSETLEPPQAHASAKEAV